MTDAREEQMGSSPQAPVNEVVVSVAFGHRDSLAGPRLGVTMGNWLKRFPNIERRQPYEMPTEHPPGAHFSTGGGIRFEMLQGGMPNVRYWLTSSSEESKLLQVQPEYFALNWRRRSRNDYSYPGYVQLRDEFFAFWAELVEGIERVGDGPPKVRQAELTYIDIFHPSSLWSSHSDTHKLINATFGSISEYEQFGLNYSKTLLDGRGDFAGRVHTAVQPGVDSSSGEKVVNLTMTARSAILDGASPSELNAFFDLAHENVIQNFNSITTSEAREVWGLS